MTDASADSIHREELPGVAKGAAFSLVCQMVGQALAAVFVVLVPPLVGVVRFGQYSVGVALTHLAASLAAAGLPTAAVRAGSGMGMRGEWGPFRGLVRFTYRFVWGSAGLTALILVLAARPLADLFLGDPDAVGVIHLAALGVPFAALSILSVNLSTALKVARHTALVKNLLESLFKLLLFLGLFFMGFRLRAALGGFVLSLAACAAVARWLLAGLLRRLPPAAPEPVARRALLASAWPLMAPALLGGLLGWVDTLILGAAAPVAVVGLFALALKLQGLSDAIPRALSVPVAPRLAGLLAAGRRADGALLYRQVGRWGVAATLPLHLLFLLCPERCLSLLGAEFTAAAPFLVLLCLGALLQGLVGPATELLAMAGEGRTLMGVALVAGVVNLTAALTLVPAFGPLAMAGVVGLTAVVQGAGLAAGVYRRLGFVPVAAGLPRLGLATLPVLVAWWLLPPPGRFGPLGDVVLAVVAVVGTFLAGLWLIGFGPQDRRVMADTLRRMGQHLREWRTPRDERRFL